MVPVIAGFMEYLKEFLPEIFLLNKSTCNILIYIMLKINSNNCGKLIPQLFFYSKNHLYICVFLYLITCIA